MRQIIVKTVFRRILPLQLTSGIHTGKIHIQAVIQGFLLHVFAHSLFLFIPYHAPQLRQCRPFFKNIGQSVLSEVYIEIFRPEIIKKLRSAIPFKIRDLTIIPNERCAFHFHFRHSLSRCE